MDLTFVGFVTALWAGTALVFQEWVLRFDLALVERMIGTKLADHHVAEQRRMLELSSRALLAIGLVVLVAGLAASILR